MLSFLKVVGRLLFKVLFSLEYHGLEQVPEEGPVIIAGNHPSYLDPILIALPLRRWVRFMAWDALFRVPLLGMTIEALGAFPVDIRRGKGEAAYREATRVLENGQALGIFPEGQRSDRGPMGEFRGGVARLAIETGAPIVPVTIGGASRAWPKWRLLPRPTKIVVRYHKPICLDADERIARREDRGYQQEITAEVAASINRSLAPALRGSEGLERLYRQPPSHIRTYEWVPLAAALVSSVIAHGHRSLGENWLSLWLPPVAYYIYLIADLTIIKPARAAKWLRNSMPIWLILVWHYPLVRAAGAPVGQLNLLLIGAVLGVFFSFFWEDYYTLQKFVRGLVVVYYISIALLLQWPHPLGLLVGELGFVAIFSLWYRTICYRVSALVMLLSIAIAIVSTGSASSLLIIYAALAGAALGYIQTFVSAAYDIRKAGDVSVRHTMGDITH